MKNNNPLHKYVVKIDTSRNYKIHVPFYLRNTKKTFKSITEIGEKVPEAEIEPSRRVVGISKHENLLVPLFLLLHVNDLLLLGPNVMFPQWIQ